MTAKIETPNQRTEIGREMYWHELSDLQKLERMRKIVRELSYTVQRLEASVYLLGQHSHSKEGHVLVSLHAMDRPVPQAFRGNSEGEYF